MVRIEKSKLKKGKTKVSLNIIVRTVPPKLCERNIKYVPVHT